MSLTRRGLLGPVRYDVCTAKPKMPPARPIIVYQGQQVVGHRPSDAKPVICYAGSGMKGRRVNDPQ